MASDPDLNVRHVKEYADMLEPRLGGTADMAETLQYAQDWLAEHNFTRVQLDRWDHEDGYSVELGYAHGEVWYKGWRRMANDAWPVTKLRAVSLHPNDLNPLIQMLIIVGFIDPRDP